MAATAECAMARVQVPHRCYAETSFQRFASYNLQLSRGPFKGRSGQGVCRAQGQPKANVRAYWHTGSAVPAANSIRANLPHAKMRRSDVATQAQRHKLLLQAEQQSSVLLLKLHWCQTLVLNKLCTRMVKLTVLMQDFCKQTCD